MEMLTFKRYINEKCWKGYKQKGTKRKGKRIVPNCVKEDYTRIILGVVEPIDIKGIGSVEAKIDSGNEAHNVLHGINIDNSGDKITFTTIDNKRITLSKTGTIDINIGSGNIEHRPTVVLSFILKGQLYRDVTFSIADRAENEQQVLIGEPFIKMINALIDVKK